MTRPTATRRVPRRLAVLTLGCSAMLAACSGELPSSAELQGMDVAGAETRLAKAMPGVADMQYFVDGKATSATEAKAMPASRIAAIDVKRVTGNRAELRITTQGAPVGSTTASAEKDSGAAIRITRLDAGSNTVVRGEKPAEGAAPSKSAEPFDGLLIVDGVKTDAAQLSKISPSSIQSVEVIKGAAAEKAYGTEGAKGVIRITTKKP